MTGNAACCSRSTIGGGVGRATANASVSPASQQSSSDERTNKGRMAIAFIIPLSYARAERSSLPRAVADPDV